ncbi:Flp family type IVb pilin [Falsiroseomonas sp.]|uniref:Flp family type IVb pilin n=1 Tax=Falsiroseomonas sp. TaxID=2870721 RepID=UPI0035640504
MLNLLKAMAADTRGISSLEYGVIGAAIIGTLAVSTPPLAAALMPLFTAITTGLST